MLVIKRKEGQSIDVGENVRIVLREIRGGHVKIGILAPKGVRVKRTEIEESVARENARALESIDNADSRLNEMVQKLAPARAKEED